jgi:hypothetical protein
MYPCCTRTHHEQRVEDEKQWLIFSNPARPTPQQLDRSENRPKSLSEPYDMNFISALAAGLVTSAWTRAALHQVETCSKALTFQ